MCVYRYVPRHLFSYDIFMSFNDDIARYRHIAISPYRHIAISPYRHISASALIVDDDADKSPESHHFTTMTT
jgi:hypothetical protein